MPAAVVTHPISTSGKQFRAGDQPFTMRGVTYGTFRSRDDGELFPEAELRFFSKTADDVVTFDLDSQGRVTRLVIHTGGRNISVNRMQ